MFLTSFGSLHSQSNDAAVYCDLITYYNEGEANCYGLPQSGADHYKSFNSDFNRNQLRYDWIDERACFNFRI